MIKKTNTKVSQETKSGKFNKFVNRVYKNTAPLLVGESVLFIIVAILMMIKPVEILTALTFVIGVALVLFGLYRVSMAFVSNLGFGVGTFDMFFGLVTLILGIVFCVYPRGAAIGVTYVFVVLFLLNALRLLFFAINMARIGFGRYMADLIMAVVMIVLSLILLFVPNLAVGTLVWMLAIYLLLYACADIYMFVKLLRMRHQFGAVK